MATNVDEGSIMQPLSNDMLRSVLMSPKLASILMRGHRIRQHTKLWFTTRTGLITCSDIAGVLGMSPYKNRKAVFKKKTGQSRPFKGNFATRRGTRLESEAIQVYENKMNKKVWPEDIGLTIHPDYPMIGGSPDGITMDGILVEVKCPVTREIISNFCPEHYVPQVQVLLEIFDLDTAHFVQYRPGNIYTHTILDVTVIKRDRVFWSKALPVLIDFMKEVVEFYASARLPVGTPMIDWDIEDAKAAKEKKKKIDDGRGTICKFINSPVSKKRKFMIDVYNGPDTPMIHKEFLLDERLMNKSALVLEGKATLEEMPSEEGKIDLALEKIIAAMPERIRPAVRKSCIIEERQ